MTRIACLQFSPTRNALAQNLASCERLCPSGAALTILPELATSGYLFATSDELRPLAEPCPGPSSAFFCALAKQKKTRLLYGFPELSGGTLYNSAALVDGEGVLGVYRKAHLFGRERELFAAGNEEWPVFDLGGFKVGVMICFDWFFPESARILALKGADLIAHPSNLLLPYCQQAMRTRALENHVYTATCNRIGLETLGETSARYTGLSQITDPFGAPLAVATADQEGVIWADIDPQKARDKRLNAYNDLLADRRPALYDALSKPRS